MSKRRSTHNGEEGKIIRTLDNLRLYDALMPAIRECALAGGGADAILKRSEVLAVLKIVELIDSDKPDVALRAATEVANRSLGKPVERTLNIYGDISKMNERDVDNQILRAIEKSGAQGLIETAVSMKQLKSPRVKQSRKPRKSDPLAGVSLGSEEQPPEGQA